MTEFKIVVVKPTTTQEQASSDVQTQSQQANTQTSTQNTTGTTTSTQTTTQDTTATTQQTGNTQGQNTQDASSTGQQATEQATTTWVTLGTKTFNITAQVPDCGIKIVSWNVQLLRNGTPIQSGATVYTTDEITVQATFTVAPNGSDCNASGSIGMDVTLDSGNPLSKSSSITDLTSQQTFTLTTDLGNLSEGSHTISVTTKYLPGPLGGA